MREIYFIFVIGFVSSLNVEDVQEGSCRAITYPFLPNVDIDFVSSLNYLVAGNRYYFYRLASSLTEFGELGEFELYYNLCPTVVHRDTRTPTRNNTESMFYGLGNRLLASFINRPRPQRPAVTDVFPADMDNNLDRQVAYKSLTDNSTFVFFANCWIRSDQRSWGVFSRTPELSLESRERIEEHAVSLGFDRREFVFLSYSNCGSVF